MAVRPTDCEWRQRALLPEQSSLLGSTCHAADWLFAQSRLDKKTKKGQKQKKTFWEVHAMLPTGFSLTLNLKLRLPLEERPACIALSPRH